MDTVYLLITGFLSVVLINNLVLTKFLGICPYLGVSGRIDMAFGMGLAVTFVMTLSGTLTWLIDHMVLIPLGLEVTRYVCFILVIASAVQLVEMYLRKFFPPLYDSFGIFLPLITTNCAILGLCLFLNLWGIDSLLEAVVLSVGGGIGFTMAICIMAGIRENLRMVDVPECLQGAPITLITAGILSLAFMGFAGII
ncbi:electron transport complex protein RnfA [Anaerobaca lacustris]|jgi:electron transport complex protein RnfA|uniref:RnfABCDGE type electron transport complex subunit A n=1 Tax=Anaerobaca lacustris TaxID=3044600 RepID=A0AAW6TW23_9BACT|nr:RnfABCDGE type electron transport complex subunit A [Sedimentisphaerales bacterium M17dextr]MDI9430962.1 RnfABCDGE type electron transport complex subunit A [Planctomycetota bacterium]MDY0356590.1 RnfABCDGE type electron transport complex subunit A [Sedimentisphaerales bacterium]NLT77604.1 RnfABCDGE type electron transport complex subunit A [Planctomycetota bacterium]